MEIPTIRPANPNGTPAESHPAQIDSLRKALTAVRKLNRLDIADREFTVVRDPESRRFVVAARKRRTGAVLDQYPWEDLLKQLPHDARQTGETSR
jgi:hypothetical protein